MNYWLIKSEPDCYSIDDLKKDKKTRWTGIRNYQARNFMRDAMKVGDKALFWHSGANPPAAVGVARVSAAAAPDATALDTKDDHYDPKSTKTEPIWVAVEFSYENTFKNPLSLADIKRDPYLKGIVVAQTGSRLSIQPVSRQHFEHIVKRGSR
jgi:predicted RNA-binding protein with PUA-like domain